MIPLDFARRHMTNAPADDQTLSELLEAAEDAVRAYCRNDFPDGLPSDVQMGIVRMAAWQCGAGQKLGIASETLSRHAVSYVQDSDTAGGYPRQIMSFCKPYRRAAT